ncbi:uncharacterized protein ACWYII_030496 [Salvelinus alpinus]
MPPIIESWEEESREDNTSLILFISLKVGLDCLILSICLCRHHTSFMSGCGLSVFLVGMALACAMEAVWFLGPACSPVSKCFLLEHASDMFNELPLPMLALGLLDYAAEPRYAGCHTAPCRALWNCSLTLLVWVLPGVRSCCSAVNNLIEVEYEGGKNPLLSSWLEEANRLTEQWDNAAEQLELRLLGLVVPAYIGVNLLRFECANSLLVGLVFWLKSDWLEPYSDLPDGICQLQVLLALK